MDNDRVVDGMGAFSVVGGIVRLELLAFKTLEGDLTRREAMEVSERLAMSLQTFLNLYQGLTRVVSELETKGVISRNPDVITDVQATGTATSGERK